MTFDLLRTVLRTKSPVAYFQEDGDHIVRSNRYYDFVTGLYQQFYGDDFHVCYQEPGETRESAQRRMSEMFIADSGISPGGRAVDLGGGVASLSIVLARDNGCRVTCVNINDHQLGIARQRARKAGVDIEFEKQDIMQLRLDKVFDAAFLIDVDSHLPDKSAALDRIAAILRPGGRLVITAWLQREDAAVLEKEFFLRVMNRCVGLSHLATFSEYEKLFAKRRFRTIRFEDGTAKLAFFMDTLYREQLELARSGASFETLAGAVRNLTLLKTLARRDVYHAIDEAFRGILYLKLCYDAALFKFGYFVVEAP
jgi:tocopherol O-methyltransferase